MKKNTLYLSVPFPYGDSVSQWLTEPLSIYKKSRQKLFTEFPATNSLPPAEPTSKSNAAADPDSNHQQNHLQVEISPDKVHLGKG